MGDETPEVETKVALGIHEDITFDDYLRIDALNHSTLKLWGRTPAHARYDMTHPQETTKSLRMGDACHVAVLDPERFTREYARSPTFDMRTNKGKAAAATWASEYPDYAALLPAEYDCACGMRDSIWAHPLASEMLKGKGHNELTIIWVDPESGLLCKGRIDRLTSYMGWTVVIDLKTAKDASIDGFAKACVNYRYHSQAAFYLDGLNVLAAHERRFIHLVIENQPPYLARLMELDESAIEEGRARCRAAMEAYKACVDSGEYPEYPVGIEGFDLPAWAYQFTNPSR